MLPYARLRASINNRQNRMYGGSEVDTAHWTVTKKASVILMIYHWVMARHKNQQLYWLHSLIENDTIRVSPIYHHLCDVTHTYLTGEKKIRSLDVFEITTKPYMLTQCKQVRLGLWFSIWNLNNYASYYKSN